jgi:hypothetical protein
MKYISKKPYTETSTIFEQLLVKCYALYPVPKGTGFTALFDKNNNIFIYNIKYKLLPFNNGVAIWQSLIALAIIEVIRKQQVEI